MTEAEEVWEKTLGLDRPDVTWSLNSLATLYADQGQYAKAEHFYERALAIWEKALARSTPTWHRAFTTWRGL
jgi:tetratricopeptide (TPR) repeat protein